jgi:hypothetical protein
VDLGTSHSLTIRNGDHLLTSQVLSLRTTVPGHFSADRYTAYPLLQWQVIFERNSCAILLKGKRLVDVAGIEPAAPCLQSGQLVSNGSLHFL